jgi:hypothetical protein
MNPAEKTKPFPLGQQQMSEPSEPTEPTERPSRQLSPIERLVLEAYRLPDPDDWPFSSDALAEWLWDDRDLPDEYELAAQRLTALVVKDLLEAGYLVHSEPWGFLALADPQPQEPPQ